MMISTSNEDNEYQDIVYAISKFTAGEFVIVMDDDNRENEGDLIIAAEHVTSEKMNFLIRNTTGIICCPMTQERATHLKLHAMTSQNTDKNKTNFTVTIDAIENVTTGVSSSDRANTANALANYSLDSEAFNRPGHIFPLVARQGGVLVRRGHTEATIDLCLLANCVPVGVIGEIMNNDGTMSRYDDCATLASAHDIPIITIEKLVAYKQYLIEQNKLPDIQISEPKIKLEAQCELNINNKNSVMKCMCDVFWSAIDNLEHTVLIYGDIETIVQNKQPNLVPIPVRIHSECFTGNILHSMHCDCLDQYENSLEIIKNRGYGVLIYYNGHEGRGIGLVNKIKAYKLQRENGLNTIDANLHLNLPNDTRNYESAIEILDYLNIKTIDLITNNPDKVKYIQDFKTDNVKITINSIINTNTAINEFNGNYLRTKRDLLHHSIELDKISKKDYSLFDFNKNDNKAKIRAMKIAIVRTRWNYLIVDSIITDYRNLLIEYGVSRENIIEYEVPGAFELPFQTKQILRLDYNAIICVGCVIKGGTPHFDYICQAVINGIMTLQLQANIPIIMGVLTTNTYDQALERSSGDKSVGKGYANTTIKTILNNLDLN